MAVEEKEIDSLDNMRREIDSIDDKMLELLAERSRYVEMVGKIKNVKDKRDSIIRPGREASMIRRISNKGGGAFSKAAIAHLWRLIIASSIMIEENTKVAALCPQYNNECYWLAREYFGPFTPIDKFNSTAEILEKVTQQEATIGVVPIWDDNSPKPWWVRLVESKEEDRPTVFAKLPFIKQAPSQKSPLVALGYIKPEPTGDDQSLWVIKLDDSVSFETIKPGLQDIFGAEATVLDQFHEAGTTGIQCYLIQMHDFISKDDQRVEKFVKAATSKLGKKKKISLHYLGSFASPIVIEP